MTVMRLPIDIPTHLHSRLKKSARLEGIPLSNLICQMISAMLESESLRKMRLPVIPSKRPGSLKLDNAKIFELIDFP